MPVNQTQSFGIMSPYKTEEQVISEPEVVTVILHYEQEGEEGWDKEATKSASQ